MISSLDTTAPLRFDLHRGRIHNHQGDTFLLLPLSVMSELCRSLTEDSLTSFGYAVGTEIGRRVAARVHSATNTSSSLADVVGEVGAELATAGFGTLGAETWGKALVFTLKDSTLSLGLGEAVDRADQLIAAVLSGMMMRSFSRDANVVALGRVDGIARFVACNPATSEKVDSWVRSKQSPGEVLARLNQGGNL